MCANVCEMCVQLQPRHTRLDRSVSIVRTDAKNTVHFIKCDAECTFRCDNSTFYASASAVRDDGYFIFRTDFDDLSDFSIRFREDDGIWQRTSVIGGIACVRVSNSVICAETCSEQRAEFFM